MQNKKTLIVLSVYLMLFLVTPNSFSFNEKSSNLSTSFSNERISKEDYEDVQRILNSSKNILGKTKETLNYFRKRKQPLQRVALVLKSKTETMWHWGDHIVLTRRLVAAMLQEWSQDLEDFVIVTDYPDVYMGLDSEMIKFKDSLDDVDDINTFDFIIDGRVQGEASLEHYLKEPPESSDLQFIVRLRGLLNLMEIAFMDSPIDQFEQNRILLQQLGFSDSQTNYPLKIPSNRTKLEIIFVNIHSNVNSVLDADLMDSWVFLIKRLLSQGREVILNEGVPGDKDAVKRMNLIFKKLGYGRTDQNKSLTVKSFRSREDLINFLNQQVGIVFTIETGLFWAAYEIANVQSVVLTSDTTFLSEDDLGNEFYFPIKINRFIENPELGIEGLEKLRDFSTASSMNDFYYKAS